MTAGTRRDGKKAHRTGQLRCYDASGAEIPCRGSGQDGESRRGLPWPTPRFQDKEGLVRDFMTGLVWTRDANPLSWPLPWEEARDAAEGMNATAHLGRSDWRLPRRDELRSLLSHQETRPPLPAGHPFRNVFQGWYWTGTTVAERQSYAWRVHMGGGRTFYGEKGDFSLLWPVSGETAVRRVTANEARFEVEGGCVRDIRADLVWSRSAFLGGRDMTWEDALAAVRELNAWDGEGRWALPNVSELESLVDLKRFGPALPAGHPFKDVGDVYWSSTTSTYEPDWAWALYFHKGAVGVGHKDFARFRVWPLRKRVP